MKTLNISGVHWKNLTFREGIHKKSIKGRDCLKSEAWTVCRFEEGGGRGGGMAYQEVSNLFLKTAYNK